jgi:mRNA interferase RelE/StbE
MYRIVYTKQGRRALRDMPRNVSARIVAKLERLAADPHAANPNVKPLSGVPGFRLRVGDWRVIYELQDEILVVQVLRISPRGGAYA